MSSYIEGKLIIGTRSENVANSVEELYSKLDSTSELMIFGQEFEGSFEFTYIGYALENNEEYALVFNDLNNFEEEIKKLKNKFKKKFNIEPYLISTFYRY